MSIIEKAVDKLSNEASKRIHTPSERLTELEPASDSVLPGTVTPTPVAGPAPAPDSATSPAPDPAKPLDEAKIENPDIRINELGLEGVLSAEGGRSTLAEEYRMIKRPLLVQAFSGTKVEGRFPNLIMVSSAMSGEGKTFTSLNLAISIAMEMDRTVLLIDSDLAKPSLSRHLQINDRPGFTECLKDEKLDLGEFLLSTDVPKLKVLPAGKRHNRSTELLASNNMQLRLNELALRYPDRVVLFDSPPLLITSESSVLARSMGQIAVVVECGVTPQYLVKEALNLLDSTESVSLILNKTRNDFLGLSSGGYGYAYGYAKKYGYGTYGDR